MGKISEKELKKFPAMWFHNQKFWERVSKADGFYGPIIISRGVIDKPKGIGVLRDLAIIKKVSFGVLCGEKEPALEGVVTFRVPEKVNSAFILTEQGKVFVKPFVQIDNDQFQNIAKTRSFYWATNHVRPMSMEEWELFKERFEEGFYD